MADNNPAKLNPADIYTITRLNREVRAVLEGSFPPVWVQGEISNLARPASGHLYLTLKDEYCQVRCAMFRNKNRLLEFTPENGIAVLVRGTVSLYEGRGEFQIILEHMEPAGSGALQQAFEALKQKLHEEGLFAGEHKKPVPHFARTIGVITSPTGAAIRDILITLNRRFPMVQVIIYPTAVQGEGAADQIRAQLALAIKRDECDVLLLARGGGSLEDLWAFNDEKLARDIYACPLPLVSGIGHEIDFTIADFVADLRAPTPSGAAEIVSPDQRQLEIQLEEEKKILIRSIQTRLMEQRRWILQYEKRLPHPRRVLQNLQQHLDGISMQLNHRILSLISERKHELNRAGGKLAQNNPVQRLNVTWQRVEHLGQLLQQSIKQKLETLSHVLKSASRALETVSPQSTLNRGYAIVTSDDNRVIRNSRDIKNGDMLNARFAHGRARLNVKKTFDEE
ncbi:MAG TPA: exodeoxyribonuclease VII large subunit [Gammaproteobacteria bacterium]|nr:exodeoxyribonuclease VII large subunit [Gammaproteobacteria bacterium]